jgi:ABC-type uncharacterized transport system involved in gliding motility auxiliary subunit
MANGSSTRPSFSRGRKWAIGLNVVFTTLVVLSVVVMINYLSTHYLRRLYVSDNSRTELSPRTLDLLSKMTNRVEVILYYDKDDMFYKDIYELLRAYRAHCPNISLERVDFNRDPGKAMEIKAKYNLSAAEDKNLIIFDCEGRRRIVPGSVLPEYTYEQITNQPGLKYDYKLVSFKGELAFTASLLAVLNPKPLHACFLQGHGEHVVEETGDSGFLKFARALRLNNVRLSALQLLGTNTVPADCDLLVVAGPMDPIPQVELDRIQQYLNDGGRMLSLCRFSEGRETGMEKLLARWGVEFSDKTVKDPDATYTGNMTDLIVKRFTKHPVVSPLRDSESQIQLFLPRALRKIENQQISDTLKVDEVAFSGPRSFLQQNNPAEQPQSYPVMVAVEKNPVKGAAERGPTRIFVVGDSMFLDNQAIEAGANLAFANNVFNWMLDRGIVLQGVGPKSMIGHRILLSTSEQKMLLWILLGALPGGVLLFGGLIWIRRRK